MAWKVKSGDTVMVLTGKDKGYKGKILRVLREEQRVVVQGAALRVRHLKPSVQNPDGGRVTKEGSIHVSNVALVDPQSGNRTRVGFRFAENGKKERYAKRSGRAIEG